MDPKVSLSFIRMSAFLAWALAASELQGSMDEAFARSVAPIWVQGNAGHEELHAGAMEYEVDLPGDDYRLRDSMERIPGLIFQESFGGVDAPRISVRGSGIQSAPVSRGLELRFNDFPLNFADGSFNMAIIEGGWVDSASLTRGSVAGISSMGGSLSLSAGGKETRNSGSGNIRYGSNPTTYLSFNGKSDAGRDNFFLAGAYLDNRGWRNHSSQQRESLHFLWNHEIGEGREWAMQLYASHPRIEVPGPLDKNTALSRPREVILPVLRDQPRRNTEYLHWGSRFSSQWDDGTASMEWTGVYTSDFFRQLLPNGIQESSGIDHHIRAGLRRDWEGPLMQSTGVDVRFAIGSRDTRRYRNQNGQKGPLIGDNKLSPWTLDALLDHQIMPWENHRWNFGLSLLSAQRKIKDKKSLQAEGADTALQLKETHWAPRFAWEWSPFEKQTLVLSWSRTYEGPTFSDLLFTSGPMQARILKSHPLKWQRADSWEMRWRGTRDGFSWDAGLYSSQWQNEFLKLADGAGSSLGVVNADATRHRGMELAVDWVVVRNGGTTWKLWANYHYTQVQFRRDPIRKGMGSLTQAALASGKNFCGP